MGNIKSSLFIVLVLLIYLICCSFSLYLFNGTGDAGDSIMHFLYAKYAPIRIELYFDQWAKPFFTLVASPFAQFGFIGIKIFNILVGGFTLYFTIKTALALNLKRFWLSGILLFAMPLVFILTFSGLTEPFFALVTILSIYLILKNKLVAAALLLSFLPFVRSEGLLILGVIGVYFIYIRAFRYIPFLLVGYVVYSVLAGLFLDNYLHFIAANPYAKLSSTYGEGTLLHFVEKLIYVVGLPVYILFWVGVLAQLASLIKKKLNADFSFLILLTFFTFFIAHSLFWYLGIFNSMGLIRVFICVAPLMALVALLGLNFLVDNISLLNKRVGAILLFVLTSFVLVFPFLKNPASINWKKDMTLGADQIAINELVESNKTIFNSNHTFLYSHPYISLSANLNHFDTLVRKELNSSNLEQPNNVDYIIWDNWFSVVEQGITKQSILQNQELEMLETKELNLHGKHVELFLLKTKSNN